jgi:hypothetical protein
MDSNAYRFLAVQTAMEAVPACYREIYEEKMKATIQLGLCFESFIKKSEPITEDSTNPQPFKSHDV